MFERLNDVSEQRRAQVFVIGSRRTCSAGSTRPA
jgi:hypothetical protein